MEHNVIHALVLLQNWGGDETILKVLENNPHIISVFHVMGRYSYLLDVNFDNRGQLSAWIGHMKSISLPAGIPAIIAMQTQRIIDVIKFKETFSLTDYKDIKGKYHFFVRIDNPHHDKALINILSGNSIITSALHVQGDTSFIAEVIVDDYDKYRALLSSMKELETIHHIETQEVISVLKYRNQRLDGSGKLLPMQNDIREIYTL